MQTDTFSGIIFGLLLLLTASCREAPRRQVSTRVIGTGLLPDVCKDKAGVIHLVYGSGDSILYTSSSDNGKHYKKPQLVSVLPGLMLVAKRGPQIAYSRDALMVLAINKAGDIFYYRKRQSDAGWEKMGKVNDVPEVAKEAFMDVCSDGGHMFYAIWLDLRNDHHNKIAGARSDDDGKSWSPNRILYASPDGAVCPCCKPSLAIQGKTIYVMFRNNLNGYRDMYVLRSADAGHTFTAPLKLGMGAWKLDACPMDGGGIAINNGGEVFTAWMREGSIFISNLATPESFLTRGSDCSVAVSGEHVFVAWKNKDSIRCGTLRGTQHLLIGKGKDAVLTATDAMNAVCFWDDGSRLYASELRWNEN
ncbi:MAG TPA: sialidase family protein [Chitinophagaceae bacterium]|nr:sialidase family protein [Chitinophagaceae bacterium]